MSEWREELTELNPEALCADGFDDAYVGFIDNHWAGNLVAVYSRSKCITILMEQGMNRDEAEEYFEFNVAGAYMGLHTPLFLEERGSRE